MELTYFQDFNISSILYKLGFNSIFSSGHVVLIDNSISE